MTLAVILLCGFLFFPRKPLYSLFLLLKKIISIIASQNKEERRCVICPWVRVVGPHELSLFFMCWPCACPHAGVEELITARSNQATGLGKGERETKGPECSHQIGSWGVGYWGLSWSSSAASCCLQWHGRNKRGRSGGLEHRPVFANGQKSHGVGFVLYVCKSHRPHLLGLLIPSFDVLLNLELS